MEKIKVINGNNEEDIWQQVTADLAVDSLLEYQVELDQSGKKIILDIDIDPGGGFESGYEFTRLTAPVIINNDFSFAIHHQDFMDKMGKLLGMEDKIIGYAEFDKQLIIKTNDATKLKGIFADAEVRTLFQSLTGFILHTIHRYNDAKERKIFLELEIQKGITQSALLRRIYHAFFSVLNLMESI